MHYRYHDSPTGRLLLAGDEGGLSMLYMDLEVRHYPQPDWREGSPLLDDVARQLDEYFAGKRQRFDVKLNTGGTEFQRQVWQALLTIPFGETRSYSQIARQIGNPTAVRAVGAANGRNPISIVAPCHRVIGASGSLTGFAGGLEAKQFLLALEGEETLQLAF